MCHGANFVLNLYCRGCLICLEVWSKIWNYIILMIQDWRCLLLNFAWRLMIMRLSKGIFYLFFMVLECWWRLIDFGGFWLFLCLGKWIQFTEDKDIKWFFPKGFMLGSKCYLDIVHFTLQLFSLFSLVFVTNCGSLSDREAIPSWSIIGNILCHLLMHCFCKVFVLNQDEEVKFWG